MISNQILISQKDLFVKYFRLIILLFDLIVDLIKNSSYDKLKFLFVSLLVLVIQIGTSLLVYEVISKNIDKKLFTIQPGSEIIDFSVFNNVIK